MFYPSLKNNATAFGHDGVFDDDKKPPAVIDAGNPGMSSGGMGDVLSGVIATLIAQGFESDDAAQYGALVHSVAADRAAEQGERGMTASDVIAQLRAVVNP